MARPLLYIATVVRLHCCQGGWCGDTLPQWSGFTAVRVAGVMAWPLLYIATVVRLHCCLSDWTDSLAFTIYSHNRLHCFQADWCDG